MVFGLGLIMKHRGDYVGCLLATNELELGYHYELCSSTLHDQFRFHWSLIIIRIEIIVTGTTIGKNIMPKKDDIQSSLSLQILYQKA